MTSQLKAFENELKAINLMVANEGERTLQMAEKVNQTMDAYKRQLSAFEDLKAKQRQMSMMFEQMKIDEGE